MKPRTLVLLLLVVQTTSIVLLMRYSKARVAPPYLSSVAVVLAEAFKLPFCLAMVARAAGGRTCELLWREVFRSGDTLRCAVPALAFTVQGNLLFLALTNLEAPTYQVAYPSKTLFTALFSRVLLSRHLSASQWLALCLLCSGTVFVSDLKAGPHASTHAEAPLVGFAAVLGAALLSASASVYFEKLLKKPRAPEFHSQHELPGDYASADAIYAELVQGTSLYVRNIQLGGWALPLAVAVALYNDGGAISAAGPLQGVDGVVWLIVVLNGCGGLLVAATMQAAAPRARRRSRARRAPRSAHPPRALPVAVRGQHRQVLRGGDRHPMRHRPLGAHLPLHALVEVPLRRRRHRRRHRPLHIRASPLLL
jgi:UDP-sugar transporter A1/2/3